MTASLRIVEENIEGVKARTILWYMTFFGFAINYIIRINASIALVDMIDTTYKKDSSKNSTIVTSECIIIDDSFINNSSMSDARLLLLAEKKHISFERRLLDYLGVRTYECDNKQTILHR